MSRLRQFSPAVWPKGLMAPIPVKTTRGRLLVEKLVNLLSPIGEVGPLLNAGRIGVEFEFVHSQEDYTEFFVVS